MEFHAALKKAMGCMGIPDMKTEHSKSIESYLERILSFPCPLDMPNVLYLPFSFCCLIDAFDVDRFLPCSDILTYRLWKLQLYVALKWSRGLLNTHALTTVGPCKFKLVNCARPSESERLYCKRYKRPARKRVWPRKTRLGHAWVHKLWVFMMRSTRSDQRVYLYARKYLASSV